jgi:uncharacterized C2H2 Zn-finger protein
MDPIEDQSGIQEILEAEIEQLEQDLQARKLEIENLRSIKPESVQEELAFDFFTTLDATGLVMTGVALAEGIWKNVVYSSDEIKKAADQLIGKPIKIEHGQDKEFGDLTVGEVIEAKWDELLKALKFKAKVTNPKAIDYVNAGRFKAVSMSTWMDKIPIGQEGIKMGLDYKFAELSLVENPACDRCFIFHCEKLSKMEKDLKEEKKENIVGEIKMEKEENSAANLEISEEEGPIVLAWVEENGELELIELSSEEELEKLKKEKKVYGYYYGYPHLYAYSPYGYYPYKYKYKKGKDKDQYPKAEGQSWDEPFEEMEDSIVCKACDAKFSNFKDFIKHWAKDHMVKYGKYKPAPGYEYQSEDLDELGLKIVFNKISKKWTVFDVPEKGLWKIKKVFDSEDEAKKFVAGGGKLSEDNAVTPSTTIVCPVCGEKFTDEVIFNKHWMDTHLIKYGEYKPKPDQSPEYGMPPGGTVNQNLEKEGKELMSEKKDEAKVVEIKKVEPIVEAPKVEPKVEVPKVEAPKEEPKVEVPKVEAPKEEPKAEAIFVQKPIEIPIVIVPTVRELPKVESVVEAPKVEAPKVVEAPIVEPTKEVPLTEEQLLQVLKEHPEAKRIILEKWFDSKRSKQ